MVSSATRFRIAAPSGRQFKLFALDSNAPAPGPVGAPEAGAPTLALGMGGLAPMS